MQTQSQAHADRPPVPWNVLPHGDIEQLDAGLWTVSGTIHVPIGQFPRRMTVVRLQGGRLLIYSGIAVSDATLETLQHLGSPAFLIVPNDHHREDAPAWKQRFPAMQVVAPAGSIEKIAGKVPVDSTAPELADGDVQLLTVPGTREQELALLVRRPTGSTLVVNDIIANIRGVRGLAGWMLKKMRFAGDSPQVPGPVKALMVKEKGALREQLLEWAALADLRRIIVSHGEIIEVDPQRALRALADSLAAR